VATIEKKAWPKFFEAVASGKKNYDFRLDDFNVREGDTLVLEEWDPGTKSYTGRSVKRKITYVGKFKIDKSFWSEEEVMDKGILIMSLEQE